MFRLIRAAVFAGALTLVLAGCGGTGADTTTPTLPTLTEETTNDATATTTTTEAVDPEEAFQEYEACMRDNGIELPDMSSGGAVEIGEGGELDFEAFEDASAECDAILEAAFGEFELSPEQEAEMMDQRLAFAQCMRDNGIDWPDPSSDNTTMIDLGDYTDPETVNAAMEVCAPEMFDGSGGGVIVGGTP